LNKGNLFGSRANLSEVRPKSGTSRTVHARGWMRERREEGRKEGRKERGGLWISLARCHAHTVGNAVCKCVQSDGSILQSVVPALIHISRSFSFPLACGPLASRGLSPGRVYATRIHTHTHTHTHTLVLRKKIGKHGVEETASQPHRPPPLVPQRCATTGWSVGRSLGIISLEAPGSKESRVSLSTAYE